MHEGTYGPHVLVATAASHEVDTEREGQPHESLR
jgi:hypothetical protein